MDTSAAENSPHQIQFFFLEAYLKNESMCFHTILKHECLRQRANGFGAESGGWGGGGQKYQEMDSSMVGFGHENS